MSSDGDRLVADLRRAAVRGAVVGVGGSLLSLCILWPSPFFLLLIPALSVLESRAAHRSERFWPRVAWGAAIWAVAWSGFVFAQFQGLYTRELLASGDLQTALEAVRAEAEVLLGWCPGATIGGDMTAFDRALWRYGYAPGWLGGAFALSALWRLRPIGQTRDARDALLLLSLCIAAHVSTVYYLIAIARSKTNEPLTWLVAMTFLSVTVIVVWGWIVSELTRFADRLDDRLTARRAARASTLDV